jgi:hypothetical protein
MEISILCIQDNSFYKELSQELVFTSHKPGLIINLYDKYRDAYTFNSSQKLICHPPCQQWCKLKGLAKYDKKEKDLAAFCYEKVNKNGGILEHPFGSSFFDYVGANKKNIYLIHQSDFGFEATKPTLLYCNNVELLPIPQHKPTSISMLKRVNQVTERNRSRMTQSFCDYLIKSVINSTQDM